MLSKFTQERLGFAAPPLLVLVLRNSMSARQLPEAGQDLIDAINQNRGMLGSTAAGWNNIKNNSPIADPETSYHIVIELRRR